MPGQSLQGGSQPQAQEAGLIVTGWKPEIVVTRLKSSVPTFLLADPFTPGCGRTGGGAVQSQQLLLSLQKLLALLLLLLVAGERALGRQVAGGSGPREGIARPVFFCRHILLTCGLSNQAMPFE